MVTEETFYNVCVLKDILNVRDEVANMLGKQIARDDCGNITHIGGKLVTRQTGTVFLLTSRRVRTFVTISSRSASLGSEVISTVG